VTKSQARKMLLAALAKCKKVWVDTGRFNLSRNRFWFPTESMIAIETTILDIVEQNK